MTSRVRSSRSLAPALLGALLSLAACSSPNPPAFHSDAGETVDSGQAPDAGDDNTPDTSSCQPCVATQDCSASELCMLLQNDSACMAPCVTQSDCADGQACLPLSTAEGRIVTVCIPFDNSCGALPDSQDGGPVVIVDTDAGSPPPPPPEDAGSPSNGYCGSLAGPSVSGTQCHCARAGQCAANNCYGGWYCDTTTNKCVNPPSSCSTPDAGSPPPPPMDGGTPPGPIGPIDAHNGGTTDNLIFAVVGDTRPGGINSTSSYPTAVINGIYGALARLNPGPDFVVTTGDYMFASTTSGQAQPQMDMYMQARARVSVPLWPAMGNHECTGATNSNCGPENGNLTDNYNVFIKSMMKPIGETLPYFMRRVDAKDGSWTAKFIFVAPNAWGPTEAAWLSRQLATPTTYTFVVHHESSSVTQAPGISQINRIVSQYPVTISIVGHTHTWEWKTKEVVIGNGGAPLTSTVPYGYTLFQRRASDGAIQISAYDYTTNRAFQSHNITATGAAAP